MSAASQYFKSMDTTAQGLYTKKLTFLHCEKSDVLPDPYAVPKDDWKSDPADWPDVQFGDIYNFLIYTTGLLSILLQLIVVVQLFVTKHSNGRCL